MWEHLGGVACTPKILRDTTMWSGHLFHPASYLIFIKGAENQTSMKHSAGIGGFDQVFYCVLLTTDYI